MPIKYPDDCIQSICGSDSWWIEHPSRQLCRGALLVGFVPHVDQVPYTLTPVGRTNATEHGRADVKVAALKVDQSAVQPTLPVAAMPLHDGEVWAAYRAKRRLCLVLSSVNGSVGVSSNFASPSLLIAPYYELDKKAGRPGYSQPFIDRVRRAEYPQFLWDLLPAEGAEAPYLLRLDQLQAFSAQSLAYRVLPYRLGNEALSCLDAQLTWLLRGGIPDGHNLATFRQLMKDTFG